jgi:hypothetical protein
MVHFASHKHTISRWSPVRLSSLHHCMLGNFGIYSPPVGISCMYTDVKPKTYRHSEMVLDYKGMLYARSIH